MRIAFSILHNAGHHLLHNDYGRKLAAMVDIWVVAVGASLSGGSTGWCKAMPPNYHSLGMPVDHTIDILCSIDREFGNVYAVAKKNNLFAGHPFMWDSKDQQVNAALAPLRLRDMNVITKGGQIKLDIADRITEARKLNETVWLWEVDADEVWKSDDMADAESALDKTDNDEGMFLADYWCGPHLRAIGEWGEGRKLPYRRLWRWRGEVFKTHEPPELESKPGMIPKRILLPQRFQHYAYYFDEDVRFKNDWYGGHEGIYEKWRALLREAENAPMGTEWPISRLISGNWGKTDTVIRKEM